MRSFWEYYKWHIIFTALVIVCASFVFIKITANDNADLRIAYCSIDYINKQYFDDNKSELELLLNDSDGNGKKIAELNEYSNKDRKKIIDKLRLYIESDDYDIYISTKEAFESIKDKTVFVETKQFSSSNLHGEKTLKDENGRIYAVSLRGNTLMERLGATSTDTLYIAAAAEASDNLSGYRKNGRNICGYIIDNKDKYNN